ncbi:hypothetical protein CN349_29085, partial [Bacillus cereus]
NIKTIINKYIYIEKFIKKLAINDSRNECKLLPLNIDFYLIWGTAEIHVILSHRLTFISNHNQIGVFSIIFEPIIIHPNYTIETKCFQYLTNG